MYISRLIGQLNINVYFRTSIKEN
ncbi:hypothetical protein C370_07371 [Cryptococcus neoformans A1-35-8]|nr:hypothetical protein C369_07299 [Cryptococcus neoformans var. grubii A5-35-17]OXH00001.1 hypothetical protein C370_07371 [Cryptococcus neoformans var. grubii A1-35-8]